MTKQHCEVLWCRILQILFSRSKKTFVCYKCHIIVIYIFCSENENFDAKMIPTNCGITIIICVKVMAI